MQTYHYRVWVPAKTGAIKLMNCQGKTFQGKFKASALDTIRNFFYTYSSHLLYTEILSLCSGRVVLPFLLPPKQLHPFQIVSFWFMAAQDIHIAWVHLGN